MHGLNRKHWHKTNRNTHIWPSHYWFVYNWLYLFKRFSRIISYHFNLNAMEKNPHFPMRFLSMTFILLLLITSNLLGLNNKLIENFESLVMGWNVCVQYLQDNKYEHSLSNYYADEVNYYGKIMSKTECIEQKKIVYTFFKIFWS